MAKCQPQVRTQVRHCQTSIERLAPHTRFLFQLPAAPFALHWDRRVHTARAFPTCSLACVSTVRLKSGSRAAVGSIPLPPMLCAEIGLLRGTLKFVFPYCRNLEIRAWSWFKLTSRVTKVIAVLALQRHCQ